MLGAGSMESFGGKGNNLGVLVEVLRYSRRFRDVDWISGDKVDKVECRCILAP